MAQPSAFEVARKFPTVVNSGYAANAADKKGPHDTPAGGYNIADKAANRHANKNAELGHRGEMETKNVPDGEHSAATSRSAFAISNLRFQISNAR